MITTLSKQYINTLSEILKNINYNAIALLIFKLKRIRKSQHTLYICGNGGSSTTASHFACDLNKTITHMGKAPIHTVCLNESIATLTAIANDVGYTHVFSFQLQNMAKKNDMLLVISGSGNSKNIIEVIKQAKNLNIETFGLLGFSGGKAKHLLDNYVLIESKNYGIIEDVHMIISHAITYQLQ